MKAKVAAGKAYVKGKVEAGKAYVKGRVEAGKAYVKGKVRAIKASVVPGKAHPAATKAVHLTKGFAMDGAGHTLFANTVNGKLLVEMASDRRADMEFLLRMALEEFAEMERTGTNKKGLKKRLGLVQSSLGLARSLHDSAWGENGKWTADLANQINAHVVTAAGLLGDIGRDYQLKSLARMGHASTWVTVDSELKGDYRGRYFRGRVYGGWDTAHGTGGSYRNSEFHRLRAMIPPGSPELTDPEAWRCPSCKKIRSDVAGGLGELTFDHNPSMVNHWATTGHNCSHVERYDWFNGVGPGGSVLVTMCRSCNSIKGGENEEPNAFKVGQKFRGRNEGQAP